MQSMRAVSYSSAGCRCRTETQGRNRCTTPGHLPALLSDLHSPAIHRQVLQHRLQGRSAPPAAVGQPHPKSPCSPAAKAGRVLPLQRSGSQARKARKTPKRPTASRRGQKPCGPTSLKLFDGQLRRAGWSQFSGALATPAPESLFPGVLDGPAPEGLFCPD
jgi:hypothetical protein